MHKTARGIFLYWHLVLDTLISQFVAIRVAHSGQLGLAAAVSVTDSLLKITILFPGAQIASRVDLAERVRWSVWLRLMLLAAWLICLFVVEGDDALIVMAVAFLFFKVLFIFDNAISADFLFAARGAFGIELSQAASIQSIVSRGTLAVAPTLGLSFVAHKLSFVYLCLPAAILSGAGVLTLLKMSKVASPSMQSLRIESEVGESRLRIWAIFRNEVMRWGILYQITGNFAFAGITYLLVIELAHSLGVGPNGLTAFYLVFFVFQLIVVVAGDKAIPVRNLSDISCIVITSGLLTIAVGSFRNMVFNIVLCSAMGLLYAIELGSIQKVLIAKLNGPLYLSYAAASKVCARVAAALGVGMLGAAVGAGVGPRSLLIVCGSMGVGSGLLLMLSNPERKRRVVVPPLRKSKDCLRRKV